MSDSIYTAFNALTGSNLSTSNGDGTDRTTVFDDHYIPTSKSLLYDEDFRTKCYFQLGSADSDSSSSSGSSNNILSGLLTSNSSSSSSSSTSTTFGSTDFWQLIINQYTESHTEKFSPYNTLSESFCWTAAGPNPVQVTIGGFAMISGSDDYRTSFLYNYTAAFRARQLSQNDKILTFVIKDTVMRLLLTSISLTETSDSPDMVAIAMTGYGYKYRNINSADPDVITSYYGTTEKVPTSSATSSTDEKKEEATTTADATDEQKNAELSGSGVTYADIGQSSGSGGAASGGTASGGTANTGTSNTKTDVTYQDSTGKGDWMV